MTCSPSNYYKDIIEINHLEPSEIYTIAHFSYGLAIRGELPPLLESHLSNLFQKLYNYDTFDALIAENLNACIVLTTVDKSKLWREALNIYSHSPS